MVRGAIPFLGSPEISAKGSAALWASFHANPWASKSDRCLGTKKLDPGKLGWGSWSHENGAGNPGMGMCAKPGKVFALERALPEWNYSSSSLIIAGFVVGSKHYEVRLQLRHSIQYTSA
ncbi:hypothetical protein Ddc_22812 [Ditylenchus destructor]|nr:hypothetical protein Ddc_22812 [Ditylenchus destructor]